MTDDSTQPQTPPLAVAPATREDLAVIAMRYGNEIVGSPLTLPIDA